LFDFAIGMTSQVETFIGTPNIIVLNEGYV